MIEQVKKTLSEADMVLVGIGEEFEQAEYLQTCEGYTDLCEKIAATENQWMMPYVNAYFLRENKKVKKAMDALKKLLAEKNYFVISVAMNGLLTKTDLRQDRIVEPCGGYEKMQCKHGCEASLMAVDEQLLEEIELVCKGVKQPEEVEKPFCKACGHTMEFNSLYAEHYMEAGYHDMWNLYTKWLQGTLNRNLCVLELGSGMMFASVLRFRFEKIVSLNQKAKLIRVHQSLYQLPEEIAERSIRISQNAVDFMAEMDKL